MVGDGIHSCGSATIYKRTNGSWVEQDELRPPVCGLGANPERPIGFGFSVDLDDRGITAIVGSPKESTNGVNSGAAYVFGPSDVNSESWVLQETFLDSEGTDYDDFGWSVAINGDFAIVGAFVDDESTNRGHAHIYMRAGPIWFEMQTIDAPGEDYFGHSVSIADRIAVIGTVGHSYVYSMDNYGTWSEYDKFSTGGSFWTDVKAHGHKIISASEGSASVAEYPYIHDRVLKTPLATLEASFYDDNWEVISQGDLPWRNATPTRNGVAGVTIESTMYEGDSELSYTEVSLFDVSWKWFSEYRITWEARNSSESVEMTQVELPGLLGKDRELAIHSIPRSFKGSWHANLLQYSNDVEIFNGFVYEKSCNYCRPSWGLASIKIFDGSTNRFKMGLHGGRIPALSFRPNDGRYSITSGMRIYTANNDGGADPKRYLLQGRNKPGVKIKDVVTESCWYITNDNTIATGNCTNDGDEYLFYTNGWGEIRSPLHIGRCVDPTTYLYGHMEFSTCHSYERGENQTKTRDNYFTFNGTLDGMFSMKSVKLGDKCIEQYLTGNVVNLRPCTGNNTQQFFVASEGVFNVSSDEAWEEISSGILPWRSKHSRNAIGQAISSTFAEADDDLNLIEVKFYENTQPYYEYKVSFPELRSKNADHMHFAELELPGKKLFDGIDGGAVARQREVETMFQHSYECIFGSKKELLKDTTRQECARACVDLGLDQCEGFNYVTEDSLYPSYDPNYEPNDCQLLSEVFRDGCNNLYYKLELFAITSERSDDDPYFLSASTSFDYAQACMAGERFITYFDISRDECRRRCTEYGSSCLGAEYHVSPSRNRECALTNSTSTVDCYDVEFFTKSDYITAPTIAPTILPVPTISPSLSPVTPSPTDAIQLNLLDALDPQEGVAHDHFGMNIAIDMVDKFLISGSPYSDTKGMADSGAANIYSLNETDGVSWNHLIRLSASDMEVNTLFGSDVAISGSTAVVSAHLFGDGGVYVFGRIGSDGPWVQQAKLVESSGAGGDRFGVSVDLAGDTLVVGADHYNSTGLKCGAVFIYKRKYFAWRKVQTLFPDNCSSDAYFGRSVRFDDESDQQFIVGSSGDSANGESSGSVYIYSYNPSITTWEMEAHLFPLDGRSDDSFGVSTALNADLAVVGAYTDDTDYGGFDVGSAYIFRRVGSNSWVQETKLESSDGMGGDGFGSHVALHRNVVLVGAPGDDVSDEGQDTRGAVYLFSWDNTSGAWQELKKISGTHSNAKLGTAVAIHERSIYIGSSHETVDGLEGRGTIYSYELIGDIIFQPTTSPSVPPTLQVTASPASNTTTGSPTMLDGVCSKFDTTGSHSGDSVQVLQPYESSDGIEFTWSECAQLCAQTQDCEFWTLQTSGTKQCLLKKNKGEYLDSSGHFEGDRDPDCNTL